ncbi:MAG: hypothetical protein IKD76_01575 [Clostridia bacterium]|nr:hypothetical protein [Clostridia bacterium]
MFSYSPAPESIIFQGTKAELTQKCKSTGMYVLRGSSGSYRLAGNSCGKIYEYADENSTTPIRVVRPDKNILRERYGKSRITRSDFVHLTTELNEGTVSLDSLLG